MKTLPQKVLVVFGTRPEAIKMAPVIQVLRRYPEHYLVRTCTTAQHREMVDQVMGTFAIIPDIDLNLMQPAQTLSGLSARVLDGMDTVLCAEKPDWVLVQGDTTSVMATALAAQHRRVNVGHVEAGLRTYDRQNPFPEEMNRVLVDHISELCFAPTEMAKRNLLREGIAENKILVTGNTVLDSLLTIAAQTWKFEDSDPVSKLPDDQHWLLVTAHRRENFGLSLQNICRALLRIVQERTDVHVIFPVHRNPEVWNTVHSMLERQPGITLLPPVDYRSLVYLLKRCTLVLTDSGGLQEEAPSLHKPVLVLRKTTERPEAVEYGCARVVGTDPHCIAVEALRLLDDPSVYAQMANTANPYGDGHASERIAQALLTR